MIASGLVEFHYQDPGTRQFGYGSEEWKTGAAVEGTRGG